MNKLPVITLKQHTPLIHFQHDQEGATLRASEVKPRLDRFLWAYLDGDEEIKKEGDFETFNKNRNYAWMNKETKSFHYKLKITALEKDNIPSVCIATTRTKQGKYEANFPFLLTNMGGKEDKGELINLSFYSEIQLHFMADDQMLLDKINEHLDWFMAITNFGCRQSKGFGSFYRDGKTLNDFNNSIEVMCGDEIYNKQYKKMEYKPGFTFFEGMFAWIEKDYKKLKAGINDSPSLLKEYFPEYDWEKTAIKNTMKKDEIPSNTYYLRILLGLTDGMAYVNEKCTAKIEHLPKGNTEEEKAKRKIDRFQSPLTIKVFENSVFMLPEKMNNKIYDQEFQFTIVNDDDTNMNIFDPFNLKSVTGFDLEKFLSSTIEGCGWKKLKQNNKHP